MSLLVWLPLNGDLHNQGCGNVTITANAGEAYYNNGKIGKAFNLNKRITFNCSQLNGLSTFSITFWGQPMTSSTLTTNWQDLLGFTDVSTSGTTGQFRFETCYNYAAGNGVHWHDNATNAIVNGSWTGPAEKGTWHHYAVVVKKNEYIKTYYDGILQSTITTNLYGGYLNGQFWIGETNNIEGMINDVRVYNHCLSPLEVKEIAQGLILHYKLDGFMGGVGDNYIVNGNISNNTAHWGNWGTATNRSVETIDNKKWLHFTASAGSSAYGGFYQDQNNNQDQMSIKPNTAYTVSARMFASAVTQMRFWFHMRSTESGVNLSQPLKTFTIDTSPKIYSYTFNTGSHSTYTINRFNLMIGAAYESTTDHEVYFTDIKFEEGEKVTNWTPNSIESGIDTTKIQDSSGYNHNGTIEDTVSFSPDSSRYNISTNFIDNTGGIQVPTMPMETFNNGNTIAFWIKPNGENGQRSVYCSSYGGNSYSVEKTTGNKLRVWWAGSPDVYATILTITDNEWQHIALVKLEDKSGIKIYKNGEYIETLTASFVDKSWSGTYRLGRDNRTDTTSYIGQMSDFRIYCTPLLDNDIKMLYNTSMRVDNLGGVHCFEFDENDNNQPKLLKNGIFKNKNYFEQDYLFNKEDEWSYNPNGNSNSTVEAIEIDVSQFYKCGKPIQFNLEYDLSWSNITPSSGGTFNARTQGNNFVVANEAFQWVGTNYFTDTSYGGFNTTALMTANPTSSTHISKTITVPASWFDSYSKARFSFRTDYATGTITLSNLKITLVKNNAKLNSQYLSAKNLIEI